MMSKKNLQLMGGVAGALLIIVIILVVLFWLDIIPGGSTPSLPLSNPKSAPPKKKNVPDAKCIKTFGEGDNKRCIEYDNVETIDKNGDIIVHVPPDEDYNARNPIAPDWGAVGARQCSMGSGKMDSDCGWKLFSVGAHGLSKNVWKPTCCFDVLDDSGNGFCDLCDPTKPGGRFPIYRKPGDPGWNA